MHGTVLQFIAQCLTAEVIRGKRVLEVGSFDINGSPREVVAPLGPGEYVGIDISPGKGVDLVCDACQLEAAFGSNSFDVVISAEMLEHVEDWAQVVSQMKRVTRPSGKLCVTTRSPGFPYHPYPLDCWRFTRRDFEGIFCDFRIDKISDDIPEMPGVFGCFTKPDTFVETPIAHLRVARAPKE